MRNFTAFAAYPSKRVLHVFNDCRELGLRSQAIVDRHHGEAGIEQGSQDAGIWGQPS